MWFKVELECVFGTGSADRMYGGVCAARRVHTKLNLFLVLGRASISFDTD
jgi:hypothetical protein